MGASALVADAVGTCGTVAIGAAVGSTCTAGRERCQGRVCHCQSHRPCQGQCCSKEELDAGVLIEGFVHEAEVPRGILGTFTDNEAVIGLRSNTLPYVQAIGRRVPPPDIANANPVWSSMLSAAQKALWNTPASQPDARQALGNKVAVHPDSPAQSAVGSARGSREMLGEGIVFDRYTFVDFPFFLPGVGLGDDVIVAFGVRTVLRLPMIGASNAQLDFDVLGTVQVPLRRLLEAEQPAEVCVPIVPKGDSLPQIACISLTVCASEMVVCRSYGAGMGSPSVWPAMADESQPQPPLVCKQEKLIMDKDMSDLMHCGNLAEHGIHALEEQMVRLQRSPEQGLQAPRGQLLGNGSRGSG